MAYLIRAAGTPVALAALLAGMVTAPAGSQESPDEDAPTNEIEPWVELSDGYGFAVDATALQTLRASDSAMARIADVGMPLTDSELEEFHRRQQFGVDAVPVLEWARSQPGFGGVAIAHERGGGAVVFGTADFPARDLNTRSLGLEYPIVYEAVEYSEASLQAGIVEFADLIRSGQVSGLIGASVDVEANEIELRVDETIGHVSIDGEVVASAQLERLARVPVRTVAVEPELAEACTAREDCWSPRFRAGSLGRMQYNGSPWRCTMGFHVTVNGTSKRQFLSAGHCTQFRSNKKWFHAAYPNSAEPGRVGKQKKTLYNPPSGGIDAARFALPNSRVSTKIYGLAPNRNVTGTRFPYVNDYICASLGRSDNVDCGFVDDDYQVYSLGNGYCPAASGCVLVGADHRNIATQVGDSGSPIYYPVWQFVPGNYSALAVGIHSSNGGGFARVTDIIQPARLNVTVYTG